MKDHEHPMAAPLIQRLKRAYRALRGVEAPRVATREVPAISAEEVAEIRAFFPLEKYFIFGHARSGTTMLARLIRLHPEVHCNYQAHFFTRQPLLESLVNSKEVGEWLSRGSNRWNHGHDLSPLVLRAAADFILEREARLEGKHIVGDKSPSSLMDGEAVRLMAKTYPEAHLIYIVRDGRDTALSHRFQTFIEFPQQLSKEDLQIRADFIRNPELFLKGEQSVFTRQALERAARGWVRNLEETDRLGKQIYGERYFCLRYEDLLAHPWEEMQRVWDSLGAAPVEEDLRAAIDREVKHNPDADWQRQKAKEIAESMQRGKQGNWREMFTSPDLEAFHAIAGATLAAWGYPLERT